MPVMTGISLREAPAKDPSQDSSGTKVLADSVVMSQSVHQSVASDPAPIESIAGSAAAPSEGELPSDVSPSKEPPKEFGGRDGLEPTRFGDWEKSGRCIDF